MEAFGATNITARDTAARIGYTPGRLQSQFDKLGAVFLQVNVRIVMRLETQIQGAIDSGDSRRIDNDGGD